MSEDKLQEQINKNTIKYQSTDFPCEVFVLKLQEGEFLIPEYQRGFEWNEEKQSRFIESVLMNLPAPSVFLIENDEGRVEISDGSQRIRTLSNFMSGNLRLNGLDILTELNGKTWNDLPVKYQRKVKNTTMKGFLFRDMDKEAQLELFRRVNTQSSAYLPGEEPENTSSDFSPK